MVFSSLKFLFYFLPAAMLLYFFAPGKYKNLILFIESMIFYTVGAIEQPYYVALLFVSVLVNFYLGYWIEIEKTEKKRKAFFIFGIVFDLGWLFLFKYADFFWTTIQQICGFQGAEIKKLGLVLPLGISFYTFQIVSYLADVYNRKLGCERSFVRFGTYVTMYPQLIAGPIVRYEDVRITLRQNRKSYVYQIGEGLKTFIIGLGLKVIIANQLSGVFKGMEAIGVESITSQYAWVSLFAYTMQLYFDFWGYSLMAIGLGKMMGFDFPKNFDQPYVSVSVTEFWRRWHMTLGSWFREYVYIPLGGNRTTKVKWIRNLFIVWVLTGFWHGAAWNFIIWGFVLFIFMFIEKIWLKKYLDRFRILGHIYVLILVPLTWAIFAVTDMSELSVYLSRLFFMPLGPDAVVFPKDWINVLSDYKWAFTMGVIGLTPYPEMLYKKIKNTIFGNILCILIFWGSVYLIYRGLDDPFLYFRF